MKTPSNFKVGDRVKVTNRNQTYIITKVGDIWDLEGFIFRIKQEGSSQELDEYFLEKHLTKVS